MRGLVTRPLSPFFAVPLMPPPLIKMDSRRPLSSSSAFPSFAGAFLAAPMTAYGHTPALVDEATRCLACMLLPMSSIRCDVPLLYLVFISLRIVNGSAMLSQLDSYTTAAEKGSATAILNGLCTDL
jgi:hypothetical protein